MFDTNIIRKFESYQLHLKCILKYLTQKCQQYFGPENRKRNVDVNGACCTTDNCNNQLPLVILSQEIPPTPSPSSTLNNFKSEIESI